MRKPIPKLIQLPHFHENNGALAVIEFETAVPFPVQRAFYIYSSQEGDRRGHHAHKQCHQFAICLKGKCDFLWDNGETAETVRLENPSQALYIPPGIWGEQHYLEDQTILLVFASHPYQEEDYIREKTAFYHQVNGQIINKNK